MRAVPHSVGFRVVTHLAHVALERIEVEDEARGLDLVLAHARHGGNVVADLEAGKLDFHVHVGVLP